MPGLPGRWSQGKTEEEALENIQYAIRGYLEAAVKISKGTKAARLKFPCNRAEASRHKPSAGGLGFGKASIFISPDGRRLVFSASNEGKSQLWVRPLDSLAAQPLPGTDGASYPFWSPDSASVGFFAHSQLKRIDIVGGAPHLGPAAC